ncbi:MarR family winged helix-turn-helix transcriptional regulator [Azospirillum picis]|uniref:DNA-binding MarR family transcriptional regulator n=1 Tax=Azospirillum picis TaxID=488438 RepID=A0ABU0MN78_9PROT|nr:MarR family transcriptional regulator [Azospirillum picis]MBP2300735.1 DNA-binding MarR family transcriptional regulator [Azospirillum picis]MDQ0534704.1 DNA-binding MarR family transcriptional regulator [Azospirillum picis]
MNTPSQAPLGFLLHDAARLLRKRFEQQARHLGLTRSQWQVLAYLSSNEGIHQGGLAELLDIEPITLVRLLDKLEAIGLIERRPHPTDRRVRLLHLTDKARPLLGSARKLGDATRAEALQGVSAADRETLVRVLGLIKCNLVEACERPAAFHDSQRDSAENG